MGSATQKDLNDATDLALTLFYQKLLSLRIEYGSPFIVVKTNLHDIQGPNFNLLQSIIVIYHDYSYSEGNKLIYLNNIRDVTLFSSSKTDQIIGESMISTYSFLKNKYGYQCTGPQIKEKAMEDLIESVASLIPRTSKKNMAHLYTEPVALLCLLDKLKQYNGKILKRKAENGLIDMQIKKMIFSLNLIYMIYS